ncbi:MAG: TlpA family protein disulfide reductase [Pirellulaceae bacterium]
MRGASLPAAHAFLRELVDKSSDRNIRGVACYSLGVSLSGAGDDPQQRAEALTAMGRVSKEFGDVIYYCSDVRHPTHVLGAEAQDVEFELRYLSVGSQAMEISGESYGGQSLKLSDFRGKVVVLDFWADWCPPCREMMPHEKQLVEELKDRPFALLGVYSDDKQKLQALVDRGEVTWDNWVDERGGKISRTWRVSSIPTIYVLDHLGRIRHEHLGLLSAEQLRGWVGDLLADVPPTP